MGCFAEVFPPIPALDEPKKIAFDKKDSPFFNVPLYILKDIVEHEMCLPAGKIHVEETHGRHDESYPTLEEYLKVDGFHVILTHEDYCDKKLSGETALETREEGVFEVLTAELEQLHSISVLSRNRDDLKRTADVLKALGSEYALKKQEEDRLQLDAVRVDDMKRFCGNKFHRSCITVKTKSYHSKVFKR